MNSGNLIWPSGPIRAAWFSADENVSEIITAWILQAEAAGAVSDEAISAFVEEKTYRMKADSLANNPMAETRGDRTTEYTASQISYWRDMADQAKKRFDSAIGTVSATSGSTVAVNEFVW